VRITRHSYTYGVDKDILLALGVNRLAQRHLKLEVTSPEGTLNVLLPQRSHGAARLFCGRVTLPIGQRRSAWHGLFSWHVASNLEFLMTHVSDDNIVLMPHFYFLQCKVVYNNTIAHGSYIRTGTLKTRNLFTLTSPVVTMLTANLNT
jgi:hypothetical protein